MLHANANQENHGNSKETDTHTQNIQKLGQKRIHILQSNLKLPKVSIF